MGFYISVFPDKKEIETNKEIDGDRLTVVERSINDRLTVVERWSNAGKAKRSFANASFIIFFEKGNDKAKLLLLLLLFNIVITF